MGKLIVLYLTVTGIAAALALAMPSLVVIGFFFLILPGLILSLAPTAFLWGLIFAAFWFAMRLFVPWDLVAGAGALAATAFVLVAVTAPARQTDEAQFRASLRPDIDPPERIAMRGDIRIDRRGPRWDNQNRIGEGRGLRGFSCDNLCLALLFTPGVRSVTVNRATGPAAAPFDREARTYRLVPKAQCEGDGLKPDLSSRDGVFPEGDAAGQAPRGTGLALQGEWNMKLANEVCLERMPLLDRHDMVIAEIWTSARGTKARWRLAGPAPVIEALEIRDGTGKILLRRFKSTAQILARPLWIAGTGGMSTFGFGWAREERTNKPRYDAIDLLHELAAHTNIIGRADPAQLLPGLRRTLRAMLDDPATPGDSPGFALLPTYLDALPLPLTDEDQQLLVRLIEDERIGAYRGIHRLRKLPVEQLQPLREAAVRRALATDDPIRTSLSDLHNLIDLFPLASFTALTADERRLLADPRRRLALPTLIARLGEARPAQLDLLIEIVATHEEARVANLAASRSYEFHDENRAHANAVGAARIAFCKLGPAARPVLPALDPQVRRMASKPGFDRSDWDFTLARLGKPIDTFHKPKSLSGDDAQYRRNLADRLARFDPERDC